MIWPGGLTCPAAFGPSHKKGTFLPVMSASATHSSIEDVAAGKESDVARPSEWITVTGLYESEFLARREPNLEWRLSGAGESAMGRKTCGTPVSTKNACPIQRGKIKAYGHNNMDSCVGYPGRFPSHPYFPG